MRGVDVERISLPSHLSPTCFLAGGECVSEAESRFRQHARPWYVAGVLDAPARLWLVCKPPRPSTPKPHRGLNPHPNPAPNRSPSPNPNPHQVAVASALTLSRALRLTLTLSVTLTRWPSPRPCRSRSSSTWTRLGLGSRLGLGPGLGLTFFFYMEQNISSLLCQLPKHQLRHGHYYHSSFLWMGLFNAVAPRFQPQPQPEPPTRARALTPALTLTRWGRSSASPS